MKKFNLIDYSLFLIQVDRNKMIQNIHSKTPILRYDGSTGKFQVTMTSVKKDEEHDLEKSFDTSRSKGRTIFKKAVFRVVEKNEENKKGAAPSENLKKGFAEIESIDGQFRFKMGIIDFLSEYSASKYFENQFKSRLHNVDSRMVSAIDEVNYQRRFVEFM